MLNERFPEWAIIFDLTTPFEDALHDISYPRNGKFPQKNNFLWIPDRDKQDL